MDIEAIQELFDTCAIEWQDQTGAPLKAVVEQLDDGVFVGFYRADSDAWVDAERLGGSLDEAFLKARAVCELDLPV